MDKDFNQSTEQAFYFIEDIENIEFGDIVSSYCNDTKVGSRVWNGSYTESWYTMGPNWFHYLDGNLERE